MRLLAEWGGSRQEDRKTRAIKRLQRARRNGIMRTTQARNDVPVNVERAFRTTGVSSLHVRRHSNAACWLAKGHTSSKLPPPLTSGVLASVARPGVPRLETMFSRALITSQRVKPVRKSSPPISPVEIETKYLTSVCSELYGAYSDIRYVLFVQVGLTACHSHASIKLSSGFLLCSPAYA